MAEMMERTSSIGRQQRKRKHEDYRIALYYCFVPIDNVEQCMVIQQSICRRRRGQQDDDDHDLTGRIRISPQGLNGVLSGLYTSLQSYERETTIQLRSSLLLSDREQQQQNLLDVKYCHLRSDLSVEAQLFPSLSIKATRQVVNLFDPPATNSLPQKQQESSSVVVTGRRNKQRRSGSREHHYHQDSSTITSFDDNVNNQSSRDTTNSHNHNNDNHHHLSSLTLAPDDNVLTQYKPARHLSPQEWNEMLLSASAAAAAAAQGRRKQEQQQQDDDDDNMKEAVVVDDDDDDNDIIIVDARNVYESRVGHFVVDGIPTLLTNTRKYSYLPEVLEESMDVLQRYKRIFMYCTGGVRCEQASVYLQAAMMQQSSKQENDDDDDCGGGGGPKEIYQLHGGIQRYLQEFGSMNHNHKDNNNSKGDDDDDDSTITNTNNDEQQQCLYHGKNFVFDLHRTDPCVGVSSKGTCVLCQTTHDDYDNGHAPSEQREARCCKCRVLVLVCGDCRRHVRCWGEDEKEKDEQAPELYCGGLSRCIDDGNCIQATIV